MTLVWFLLWVVGDNDPWIESANHVGLKFVHQNGMTGQFYILEEMGPGCALIDIDNDGDLDVYFVQGHRLPGNLTHPSSETHQGDQLYKNLLVETGQLQFTNITDASGIKAFGYGIGVAQADVDRDGWTDIYTINYGPNQLWRNKGNGQFEDITALSQTGDPGFGVSASFFDADGDGFLDLYVANYVQFTFENHKICLSPFGVQDYCGPNSYEDAPDVFFLNKGQGKFDNATKTWKLDGQRGSGLGVIAADFNDDHKTDIYVANDADPNFLWINRGDRFEEDGIMAGCALNINGATEASMGVQAADIDGDGDQDIFMTHLNGETNTLYRNDGNGLFSDVTLAAALGASSLDKTGFGTGWLDYDNDGLLDLFVANGAVHILEHLKHEPFPLHQTNQLYRAITPWRFEEVTASAGAAFKQSEVSRGAAFGDIDNDGDTDILLVNNNGPARLLINRVGHNANWLGIQLKAGPSHCEGALITVSQKDSTMKRRRSSTDGSFASSNDARILVGLGQNHAPCQVEVKWPNGEVDTWSNLVTGTYHTLVFGKGKRP
ncbi:MAG: CRTAC1 family protein [Acidobacteria bacterium]|nr:CRTAC1 family protein [Acidobacteriota bacterium]